MADFELLTARPDQAEALQNLVQLYTHDFSEQWFDRPLGELDEEGRFQPYPLEAFWKEPGHEALLVRKGGRIAGFALLNVASHTGRPVDHNVAEFFIVRKHRRGGLASAAVREILDRWPGQWEAAVTRRNAPALAFWRKAVSAHPRLRDYEEIDVNDAGWNGLVLHFRIEPA